MKSVAAGPDSVEVACRTVRPLYNLIFEAICEAGNTRL